MTTFDLVVTATLVSTLTAILLGALKKSAAKIPGVIWQYLLQRFTVSVTFKQYDSFFDMTRDWLAQQPYADKARNIKLHYSSMERRFLKTPGYGNHLLWFHKTPIWIKYVQGQAAGNGQPYQEDSYTVTMLARDPARLNEFIEEIGDYKEEEVAQLYVYTFYSGYWHASKRRKRDMSTVYLPKRQKDEILNDISSFLKSEKWYEVRGIPYRRGYLLYGPPGTGKTTLVTALGGYFNRAIYCMNLNSISSDSTLLQAFNAIPHEAIVLIEDMDAFEVSHRRAGVKDEETPKTSETSETMQGLETPKKTKSENDGEGITISGLLNAIDGVTATEGRILVVTTNDIDKLDPALIRSGRIDKRIEISHLEPDEVVQMFKNFYPDSLCHQEAVRRYASTKCRTAAVWQNLFIKYHDSVDRLFTEVIEDK